MKILIYGTGSLDCAAANCGIALKAMGHDVLHFDPEVHPEVLGRVSKSWASRRIAETLISRVGSTNWFWERPFLRTVSQFGPDLILTTRIDNLTSDIIGTAKRESGAKFVGWYQDHVVNFGRHSFLAAPYDALFFKDPYIVERLRDYGGLDNVHFLPEGCEPRVHHSLELSEEDTRTYGCDLMTYGNAYTYRIKLLENLLDYDLRLYGARMRRWYGSKLRAKWQEKEVYYDDKIKAVLAAKVVVSTSHFGEVRSANARIFEVAGIGGFQIADAPGVPDYFVPGEEIVVFKGPKELRDLINHYLERPDERRTIAARGQARAHREHTYEHRLKRLLDVSGLYRPGDVKFDEFATSSGLAQLRANRTVQP